MWLSGLSLPERNSMFIILLLPCIFSRSCIKFLLRSLGRQRKDNIEAWLWWLLTPATKEAAVFVGPGSFAYPVPGRTSSKSQLGLPVLELGHTE
ncbi:hypothetical protein PoB_006303200 [Plakobranchus ocellatus]|uniref:Secreted protein n=1 Tax=Plakobranchus ocellatus TaxID=259542 RepID=A0AAV4CX90_9GAST|nr:hypothetical protein PoB_006303200 [Plakobranchus ocellatus]